MDHRVAAMRLFDEVRGFLDSVRGRYSLALVTNGNSWPEQVGLSDHFQVVVNAAEVGVRKPDPAIFAHVWSRLDVPPSRCLHVGDHAVQDIVAGRDTGMPVAWCNRNSSEWDPSLGDRPLTVSVLDELTEFL